jgi:DNA-binding CsgD family transcriptional regulator
VASFTDEEYLAHYGVLRKSGRYPWGSGGDHDGGNRTFLETVEKLRKEEGMSETDIARGFGISVAQLRSSKAIAKNEVLQADIARATRLRDKGESNMAIARIMGKNESTIRSLLDPAKQHKADVHQATTSILKQHVAEKKYIDVGTDVERHMNVSRRKLDDAIRALEMDGYRIHYVKMPQLGTGLDTTMKVLAAPGVTSKEVYANRDKIDQPYVRTDNKGLSYDAMQKPLSISSKRVAVKYGDEGGSEADGVIFVRPGVKDVALGSNRYAQVRILVDGTHYLKGMAIYRNDLPPGVDLQFNTNKNKTGNKLDAMKAVKPDADETNPFGAGILGQIGERQSNGSKKLTSVMNIVNGEGDWDKWSRSLSSQMLSKQTTELAKEQLGLVQERKRNELDSIMAVDNPSVRKKLLQAYADSADSASVHLKAAALPGQESSVILPLKKIKPDEVYAPNFENGTRVVLVRHPHGGIFEIPELKVNNRNVEGRELLGDARDAIGIHSKVAERLSGADFDGDTVLVIPNNSGKVKTAPALEGLKNFDPIRAYPGYKGMEVMDAATKATEMGKISNLITDMTIKKATQDELARAVRHSMVVIDAEKHKLNYKLSEQQNGIAALKKKYQTDPSRPGIYGSSTLISKASSRKDVLDRKARSAKDGGPIDPVTGKKMWVETGKEFPERKLRSDKDGGPIDPVTGEKVWVETGKMTKKTIKSTKLAEVDNAHTLSSGTVIEKIYADHSNRMKSLANEARRELLRTKPLVQSPAAKEKYKNEVTSLNAKLDLALRNSPLERQAQVIANANYRQKLAANPNLEDSQKKKIKFMELETARNRVGAGKPKIDITDREWEAIQAGAISGTKLDDILRHADIDKIKELATPKEKKALSSGQLNRALVLINKGYTMAEVAKSLGVSVSTLKSNIGGARD